MAKGTRLGYVTDFTGTNTLSEAEAPSDGMLLIRFESPPASKGDTLAVLAVLEPSCDNDRLAKFHNGMFRQQTPTRDRDNDLVALWNWASTTGWLVAIGLGVVLGRLR